MDDFKLYKTSGLLTRVERLDRQAAAAFTSRLEEFQAERENQQSNFCRNYEGFSE